jgi:hypothetical protein
MCNLVRKQHTLALRHESSQRHEVKDLAHTIFEIEQKQSSVLGSGKSLPTLKSMSF